MDDANREETPDLSPLMRLVGSLPRPHRIIPMPGRYANHEELGTVAIVALRDSELVDARFAALKFITELKKLPEWQLDTELGQAMLDNEMQVQVLHLTMRQPKNLAAKYTSSPTDVRMNLEPDERMTLWNEYVAFQHERSPLRTVKTDEELEELVSALGKGSFEATELSYFDTATLRTIIIELGDAYRRRMKQLSSATTPASDSTP